MESKELKLARESLKADCKPKNISLDKMAQIVDGSGKNGGMFYLDKDNSQKDIGKMESFFKAKGRSIMIRELHYSMDNKDFIYEVHVL